MSNSLGVFIFIVLIMYSKLEFHCSLICEFFKIFSSFSKSSIVMFILFHSRFSHSILKFLELTFSRKFSNCSNSSVFSIIPIV